MFGWFIRFLVFIGIVVISVTLPLGSRTLFGHITNIWSSEQTQELVEGVVETSGPLVDKIKRGVEAGSEEMQRENVPEPDAVANLLLEVVDIQDAGADDLRP